MKKKIFLALLFMIVLTLTEVKATEFSAYLPAGKNYFDINNLIVNGNYMTIDDDILVKANTDYTISFPGFDLLGSDVYIVLSGESNYLDGEPADIPSCNIDATLTICTFTTSNTESLLYFELYANNLSLYYSYYGIENFQLEEGLLSTSYEEYIAPFIDSTTPEFSGVGAYITSYQSNENISSIISNHVLAIDDIDGNISDQIIIVSDEYTANEQIIGDYDVHLSVTDSSGNEALFILTIMVKDEIAPIVTGPSSVIVNVENYSTADLVILDNFYIYDDYDNLYSITKVVDEYNFNIGVLGDYLVIFDVFDQSLNSTRTSFTITVVDTTPPVMVGENIYNSYLSDPLYLNTILGSIGFTDNYDNLDLVEPTVINDNFSSNELIPGTYIIEIQVEDNSSNVLLETLTVNVIDDISPIINGPISYSESYTTDLLVTDFIDMLNVSDNIDVLTINDIYIISDTYSTRTSVTGDYMIVFGIMDSNNNETTHTLTINLFDDVAPVIYVDNYIVTVNLNSTFSENDALRLLLNSNELAVGNYTIIRLIDEYTGNEKNPGSYIYKLSFKDDDGNVLEKEFLVKVKDDNSISFQKNLLTRNIAIYSSIFGYSLFVILKRKRLGI